MSNLLQILEPGSKDNSNKRQIPAVGIDLGTTNSLVAIVENGQPKIIPMSNGNNTLPSVVSYANNDIKVGESALSDLANAPLLVIKSVKRLMGKVSSDKQLTQDNKLQEMAGTSDSIIKLELGERTVTPIEVSAEILKALKKQAENYLDQPVSEAVITVPAYFDEAARAATKDAARLAGLDVLRLLNEPTAAALAYGLDTSDEGLYAIYDLGGGTFDLSLLKLEKGVFQVLATGGDTTLGGDDFDHLIADMYLAQDMRHAKEVKALARQIKEQLTLKTEVSVEGSVITRESFDQLIAPLVLKSLQICQQVLDDANLTPSDIKGVILVGGATRIPYIQSQVEEFFGQKPYTDIDPDCSVAWGAAIQAHALTMGSDTLLLDVTPLSLGIETMGGLAEKIIHRNTPIPVSKAQEFTTYQDGQTAMAIHVIQGEREMVEDCRSLARFELLDIPQKVAGATRIEVTFTIDADGLLTVDAKELTTGIHQNVHVKPSYGLSEEELTTMIRSSYLNAQEDMNHRLLAEAIIDAQRLTHSVEAALEKDRNLLDEETTQQIQKKLSLVREKIALRDKDEIQQSCSELDLCVQNFAELRMNKAIGDALRGQDVDKVFKDN